MQEVDLNRPVRTRDGKPVRVLASDLVGTPYCVVGVVTMLPGKEVSYTWTKEGLLDTTRDDGTCPDDLVNVPDELIVYVGAYRDSDGVLRVAGVHDSAGDVYSDAVVGVSKVTIREDQFDE